MTATDYSSLLIHSMAHDINVDGQLLRNACAAYDTSSSRIVTALKIFPGGQTLSAKFGFCRAVTPVQVMCWTAVALPLILGNREVTREAAALKVSRVVRGTAPVCNISHSCVGNATCNTVQMAFATELDIPNPDNILFQPSLVSRRRKWQLTTD